MGSRKLAHIDVNLLVTLDVLLRERSVTTTARELGVTQSAISQALGRLRFLLGDDLLVRSGTKMVPTPRAEELASPLRRALDDLQAILTEEPVFSPSSSERTFTLATNDYNAFIFFPHLLKKLASIAPQITVNIRPIKREILHEQLVRGEIDLGVGVWSDESRGVRFKPLYGERFACLVRKGHPFLESPEDIEAFASYQHILVSPQGRGGSVVSTALEELGLERRVAVQTPFFLSAPALVAETDYILTVPARVAYLFAQAYDVVPLPPPLELPTFTVKMIWHERYQNDTALMWLRSQLVALGETLPPAEEITLKGNGLS